MFWEYMRRTQGAPGASHNPKHHHLNSLTLSEPQHLKTLIVINPKPWAWKRSKSLNSKTSKNHNPERFKISHGEILKSPRGARPGDTSRAGVKTESLRRDWLHYTAVLCTARLANTFPGAFNELSFICLERPENHRSVWKHETISDW